ncbi:MAG: hypothetical protein F9K35_16705 [Burkholderiaceae bacterium]|nr:MAG: hypothetical protein F9K35_16705 [Burkholderiaceae bacterium]
MKHTQALLFAALCAATASAMAQEALKEAPVACPGAAEMDHRHLQGLWRADIEGQGKPVLLRLGPHPELAESVRGTAQRGGTTAQVAGDVDAGALTLEESLNGTNISATWIGQVVDGSCGKEVRGTWSNAQSPDRSIPFVLRKQAGQP